MNCYTENTSLQKMSDTDYLSKEFNDYLDKRNIKSLFTNILPFHGRKHGKLSCDVDLRLFLRHNVLLRTIKNVGSTRGFNGVGVMENNERNSLDIAENDEKKIIYNLAVTDMFVEKAIAYLDGQANRFRMIGYLLSFLLFITFSFGVLLSIDNFYELDFPHKIISIFEASEVNKGEKDKNKELIKKDNYNLAISDPWLHLAKVFIRGFTMYGMIIILAVGLFRLAKAMLDQSERLSEKRHALRHGRLFIHLRSGKVTIEEMEKAFSWNQSNPNAFGQMTTDTNAPWGGAINKLVEAIPETIKSFKR
ncbi:MAG: hypothetical protein HQL07_07970 [Nitrospirae bacterium]|nr:hypothetical protein [Magnetococcales bacterium]HAT50274.1 hypothetical protein [Alphaproteobacteria bacterium]